MLTDPSQNRIDHNPEVKRKADNRGRPAQEFAGSQAAKDDKVTVASNDSFPASDAPAWTMGAR